jgi:hypothetical protein
LSPTAQLQSPSGSICTEQSSIASSAAASTQAISIPDHWRPEVEDCLRKMCLTPNARQEIVRTVASQLFAKSQRPTRSDCDQVARQLILKYPFTKDDLGCGYVSFSIVVLSFANMYALGMGSGVSFVTSLHAYSDRGVTK